MEKGRDHDGRGEQVRHDVARHDPQRAAAHHLRRRDEFPVAQQDFRNPPDLMIQRNRHCKIEAVEELPLIPVEPTHHCPIS
jgi:hypothetical protein